MPHVAVRFVFVNDGSRDGSGTLLSEFAAKHPFAGVITFSRNFGHQIAITAGIDVAYADYVAIIDADLQDPPELIRELYEKAQEGNHVVHAKRLTRKGETAFKRLSAKLFYRLMRKMCDIDIPMDTGDFRLISKRVAEQLRSMRERHRYVRGMIPWTGFSNAIVEYHRDERYAGETKYPLRKMIAFSKDAMFSFSRTPLRVANLVGWIIVFLGIIGSIAMLYIKLMTNLAVPGITAILITIVMIGGIQIIMLGIIGEYIGRMFEEAKGRPLYIVAHTQNFDQPNVDPQNTNQNSSKQNSGPRDSINNKDTQVLSL